MEDTVFTEETVSANGHPCKRTRGQWWRERATILLYLLTSRSLGLTQVISCVGLFSV